MQNLTVKTPFVKVVNLIREASSQDVMLINETSPAMARFLNKDNTFRTFQLNEDGPVTNIRTTKSDDPKSSLEDFLTFIAKLSAKDSKDSKATAKRMEDFNALSLEEAKKRREQINKDKDKAQAEVEARFAKENKRKVEVQALNKKQSDKLKFKKKVAKKVAKKKPTKKKPTKKK